MSDVPFSSVLEVTENKPQSSALQPQPEPAPSSLSGASSAVEAAAPKPAPAMTGSKRPLKTTDNDGEQLSEKKLRRLEKNRLSARECRRRKREATENLEREINVLEGENLKLRLQLQIGEEAEESMRQEQEKLTSVINESLKSGASETEIYATIEEFKEKFADYGRDRRSAMEFHMRNVERLLMPTQTTSVAMRALHGGSTPTSLPSAAASLPGSGVAALPPVGQPVSPTSTASAGSADTTIDSVLALDTSNPALDPKAMFQYLVNYLNVTPAQAAALKDSRWVAQDLDQTLAKSLAVLDELRSRLIKCGEDLETEFNNVRAILTPTQAAKFLVWVANNGACMHMLNELWSRSYPKTTSSSTQPGADDNASPEESKEL